MNNKCRFLLTVLSPLLLCAACNKPLQSEAPPPTAPATVESTNRALKVRKSPIGVGDPVPDFSLQDQGGREVSTGELISGKGSVLVFVPDPQSASARPAYAWANQHAAVLSQRGLELLLVSPANNAENARLAGLENLHVAVLSDPASWVARAFGVAAGSRPPARPYTVLVGGDGRVQFAEAGLTDPPSLIMAAETRPGASTTGVLEVFK